MKIAEKKEISDIIMVTIYVIRIKEIIFKIGKCNIYTGADNKCIMIAINIESGVFNLCLKSLLQ